MTTHADTTTAPPTIADIIDPRLRAVVRALVTVVEEADTGESAQAGGLTVEQAWAGLDDDRGTVLAAAQACIDALDAIPTEAPLAHTGPDGPEPPYQARQR